VTAFNAKGDVFATGDMKFGKKSTAWMPLEQVPRNFIE